MKFVIEKNILLESLTNVMRALSPRNTIPILNGVMFDLTDDGLYLTATDSDLIIKKYIDKKEIKQIFKTGKIVIQSKTLLDIFRKLPDTDINIEVIDSQKIVISTENSMFNLNCLNTLDYPELILETVDNPIVINSSFIKEMVSQTLFAASIQESRPILTGLNLKIVGNNLECNATDSYRMAKKTIKLDKEYNSYDIVVPGKNINELDKILTEENDVEIHLFNNKILFKYMNYEFQSSLLSGNFPQTENLIPNEFTYIITTSLQNYYNAIDRASLLTQNKDKNIIKMETNNNELKITSYSSEIGKYEENILINKNIADDITISYSSKYMMDALKTFKNEEIIILLNGPEKPIVLKAVNDESLVQIIVPIKTY